MLRSFALFSLLLTAPVVAQTPAGTPPVAKAEKPKLVCRRDVETGSIMLSKKTCHTRDEWKVIDGTNAANVDRFRDRGNGRVAPAGT